MPTPTGVVISYDGGDITDDVLWESAKFESLMNAMPGTAEITVRDREQTRTYIIGKEVTLELDGQLLWGGYVQNIRRKFALPVVDTSVVENVTHRQFVLSLIDYNVLFDKRVVRNSSDYLHQLPNFDAEDWDGDLIKEALQASLYVDVGVDFDVTTQVNRVALRTWQTPIDGAIDDNDLSVTVDDVGLIPVEFPFYAVIKDAIDDDTNREIIRVTAAAGNVLTILRGQQSTTAVAHADGSFFLHLADGAWVQQGSPWRALMEDFVQFTGAVYYITPDKILIHKALEDVEARWGFSDIPNYAAITSDPGYQGATIGPRELDAVEDGMVIVNDALIWGGSDWSGEGETVFARRENATSQSEHQRWQVGEVHFGEDGYKLQSGVDARAKVIVDGEPGSVGGDPNRGLRYPQWTVALSWFAHRVPTVDDVHDHLKAGDLVHITSEVFGDGGDPLELILPLRRLAISFPGKPDEADVAWVQFQGTFSLQLTDPFTLWRFLLGESMAQGRQANPLSTVTGSGAVPFGSIFQTALEPDPDGVESVFNLPNARGYIAGTTQLYVDGVVQRLNTDYYESNPDQGEVTFIVIPDAGSWTWITCRTT